MRDGSHPLFGVLAMNRGPRPLTKARLVKWTAGVVGCAAAAVLTYIAACPHGSEAAETAYPGGSWSAASEQPSDYYGAGDVAGQGGYQPQPAGPSLPWNNQQAPQGGREGLPWGPAEQAVGQPQGYAAPGYPV